MFSRSARRRCDCRYFAAQIRTQYGGRANAAGARSSSRRRGRNTARNARARLPDRCSSTARRSYPGRCCTRRKPHRNIEYAACAAARTSRPAPEAARGSRRTSAAPASDLMPHNPHHRCDDCGALLARSYPYNLCPKHWRQRYNAPPGECRIDYFEAAVNPARDPLLPPILPGKPYPGGAIAASERT